MDKYMAREIFTGKDSGSRGYIRKTAQSQRKKVRAQLRQIEKQNLDSLDDVDLIIERTEKAEPYWNTNSLWNFLRSQTGKSWDEIYSKVCESFDPRTNKGSEIRALIRRWIHPDRNLNFGDYFYLDEGVLRYRPKVRPSYSWKDWDSMTWSERQKIIDKCTSFTGVEPFTAWMYGYPWVYLTRKIIRQGNYFYWAYRIDRWHNSYIQREELSQNEVKFFLKLPTELQEKVLYTKCNVELKDVVEK